MTARLAVMWLGLPALVLPAALARAETGTGVQPCARYGAEATASGTRLRFAGDNVLPLTNAVEVAGPVASALISPGISGAYAGAPHPGDTALSSISLAGGAVGDNGGPSFDSTAYPLVAQSQYPTQPDANVEQPGVGLRASSAAVQSNARASVGGAGVPDETSSAGAGTANAAVSCSPETGITADADSDNQALSFQAGVLRIGRVRSEAHAAVGPDGTPTVTANLDVGQFTVAGQTVEASDDDQALQLPDALAGALADAGIAVRYLSAVPDADGRGITAPGLEVTMTVAADQAGVGTSPTTVTVTIGRASARVDGAVGAAGVPAGSAVPSAPVDRAAPATGLPTTAGAGTALSPPRADVAQPMTEASPPTPTAAASFEPPAVDWQLVYAALVTGAVALTGGSVLVRSLGERLRWI